jgi:hypothetical protein
MMTTTTIQPATPGRCELRTCANPCEENAIGRDGTRTHTGITPQGILSPQCLPFHHAAEAGYVAIIGISTGRTISAAE